MATSRLLFAEFTKAPLTKQSIVLRHLNRIHKGSFRTIKYQ